ncbi:hypothetical protein [Curtobacterium sp. DN_7.5]|uniref:hypothetical protein n=1 Tax=Curtobacterium sp. DN_7.5 TaxID=3049047 RepID=UPI001F585351|nr:hypothetical protein [Curtobacterium sp. DN_7.5]
MTDVRLDAFGIARDGNDMATASHDLATAWTSLQSVLSGSGGMAGPDEASKEWIDSYDSIAKQAGEASEGVATALAAFDSIMGATGQAYKRAELAGALQDSDGGISVPTHEVSLDTSVPTAMGEGWPGALGEFQGWVEEALASMGLHLPLADTDKMGTAVSAWRAYDDQLQSITSSVAASLAVASSSDIPQWASMSSARSSVVTTLGQMSTAAGAAVEALDALIDQTVTARNEIMDIVKELAIAVGVEVGVSVALSFFTFGASAVVGAAATSATVMRFVVRIAEVIQRLITLSRIPREAIENGVRLFQAVGRGSKFARIAGETFKGMATGVVSQGFSNILVEGKSFSEGWQGALLGGAVGGTIGGGLGLVGRTGREAAATRSTVTHVAVSTGRGAVTGAAGGVGGDYVTAKVNGQDFNVIQSLVFGTVGGAVFDGGHGAVEAHHAHAGGGSTGTDLDLASGAASEHGPADLGVDTDTHAGDAGASAAGTASATQVDVVTRPSTHAAAAGDTAPTSHSGAAGGAAPTEHADAPVVSGAGTHSSTTTHAGERPSVDGSQTPVVTDTAHTGGTTTHAGGEDVVTHVEHVEAGANDGGGDGSHSDAPAHGEGATHAGAPATHADGRVHADAPAADAPATQPGTSAPHGAAPTGGPAHSDAVDTRTDAPATHVDASPHGDAIPSAGTSDHAGPRGVQGNAGVPQDGGAATSPHQTGTTPDATTVRSDVGHVQSPTSADVHAAETHVVGSSPGADQVRAPGPDGPLPSHDAAAPAALSSEAERTAPADRDASAPVEHVTHEHAAAAGTAVAGTALSSHPGILRTDSSAVRFENPSASAGTLGHHGGTGNGSATGGSGRRPLQVEFSEEAVAHDAAAYRSELDARLHDHGLSRREFRRLVSKPIHRLSADEMDTLIDIRDGLDPIRSGDVIQKVMPLKQAIDMVSDITNGDVGYYAQKGVPGFIAKFAHLTAISNHGSITPLRVFQKLGLGYNTTAFPSPSTNPIHGVRMRTEPGFDGSGTPTSDVYDRMLPLRTIRGWMQDGTIDEHQWNAMSIPERRDRLQHLVDRVADTDLRIKLGAALERNSSRTFTSFDPFRGNGWAGHYEHYTPEVELRQNTPLTPGAELWRYNVDGTQEILAKWDGVRWHMI